MSEIPEDIRKAAADAHAAFARSSDTRNLGDIIAEAIFAERERCAKLVEANMLVGNDEMGETIIPRSNPGNKVGFAYARAIRGEV